MADVVFVYVTHAPNMLHHNNVGVTYPITSNLRMELVTSVPLYYVAMLQSMVIVTETPFVTTLAHIVVNMRSKPYTPTKSQLVSVHIEVFKEVDKIFARQPLDPGGGGLDLLGPLGPPRPSRYLDC